MQNWMAVVLNNFLDQTQIATLLNKADAEECETGEWARQKARMTINSFASVTYPSITATQGSTLVQNNSGNFAAVTAQMAFRVSSQFYSPISVVPNPNTSSTLNLTAPWPSAGGSGLSGVLMQLYYSVPNWQEITGVKYLTDLRYLTQDELDRLDPWFSQIASPALRYVPAGMDTVTVPGQESAQVTLWPIETAANPYTFRGIKGHVDMVNPNDTPLMPATVIVAKALAEACETLYVLRGDSQWQDMRNYYRQIYETERDRALERDRKQYGVIHQVRDSRNIGAVGLDIIPFRDSSSWE